LTSLRFWNQGNHDYCITDENNLSANAKMVGVNHFVVSQGGHQSPVPERPLPDRLRQVTVD